LSTGVAVKTLALVLGHLPAYVLHNRGPHAVAVGTVVQCLIGARLWLTRVGHAAAGADEAVVTVTAVAADRVGAFAMKTVGWE
jgi:hypothetical protein